MVCRRRRRSSSAFTLIEMLVVIGIIILVSAVSLPVFLSMGKGGKLRQAKATITGACLVARSRAIRERRKFSVTVLEREKCVIINDYSLLENILPLVEADTCQDSVTNAVVRAENTLVRTTSTVAYNGYYATLIKGNGIGQQRLIVPHSPPPPAAQPPADTLTVDADWVETTITGWQYPVASGGDEYLIGGKTARVVCPHRPSNFAPNLSGLDGLTASSTDAEKREHILKAFAIGGVRELPEGVSLDLDDSGTYDARDPQPHAWTWIFLPTGGVITLDTAASNQRDDHWHESTYTRTISGKIKPWGPRIYGPQDEQSAIITVYAMTGQAKSE